MMGIDMNMIEENLYLGGESIAENIEVLKEKKIKYVLSVFNDDLKNTSEDITYKKIDVEDNDSQDLLTHFPEANEFIAKAQASKQNVLVHCHAGVSRSPTFVMAFLMNKYKKTYETVRKIVGKCRSIWPNDGFVEQLKLYEKMGFTLKANNKQLRQHLVNSYIYYSKWSSNKSPNKMETYFERREFVEKLTQNLDLGKKYVCDKCGQHLFNEIHILLTNVISGSDSRKRCNYTYIEPQKWKGLTQPFDQMSEFGVKCPKCGEKVIEFQPLFASYSCKCCLHSDLPENSLRFRIENQKFKTE